ncbi:Transmembrane protease serine 6 [Holothuria leucospilota]|uniref:Transmembrane protease serine 6 n=1 Tax=Holothuria leucospilota TaxID=206669 RepID=A0A9Q1BC29_HOLLE|nr:Transmembrane protease serine 6 [Holothuria leucospilota]
MKGLVLLTTVAFLFSPVIGQSCPAGWIAINDRCFLPVSQTPLPSTLAARRLYCLRRRSDLARFEPWQDFQSELSNAITFPEYYIGLSDSGMEGDFRWVTDNTTFTSDPWISGQPDGGTAENCVVATGDPLGWSDTSCNRQLPFICERPAANPPCGTTPASPRIVGGSDSTEGAWPWQGSLQNSGGHFCGASLISAEWAITAAHCFTGSRIVFGDLTPSSDFASSSRQESDVTWFLDPLYQFNSVNDYDIALLYLHTPVTFTDFVRPVCVYETVTSPETDSFPPELTELDNCYIAGWGALATDGEFPEVLQEAPVDIFPPSSCSEYGLEFVQGIMLCAGSEDFSIDSCQGDSGGPLMCQGVGTTQWFQAGVVSFGRDCASEGFPGVYTRLATTSLFVENTRNLASNLFRCPRNGNVILDKQVCNNIVDCDDYADEIGCDPIMAGDNIQVTSPKFQFVTNLINREWIFFPPADRIVTVSFTLNNLPGSGNLTIRQNIGSAMPSFVPTVNMGDAPVSASSLGPGEPIVISMDKTTINNVAGFQATISA